MGDDKEAKKKRMSTKVSIVMLMSILDENKQPLGHLEKQLRQTYKLLLGLGYSDSDIEIVAPKGMLSKIKNKKTVELPFDIYKKDSKKKNDLKIVANYLLALVRTKGKVVWYPVIVERILQCFAILFFKKGRTAVGTSFQDWDDYSLRMKSFSKVRKAFINRGLKKLDLCIMTYPEYHPSVEHVFLPDYYREEKEKKLFALPKKEQILFIGEVRKGKGVDKLLKLFGNKKILLPLLIKGKFTDNSLKRIFDKKYSESIMVEDKNLSNDEYWRALSESKYVILPYDKETYKGRTSGVLLDAVFVGAIPIAPRWLLEGNHIVGIAYDDIAEIPQLIKNAESKKNDLSIYEYEYFIEKLKYYIKAK